MRNPVDSFFALPAHKLEAMTMAKAKESYSLLVPAVDQAMTRLHNDCRFPGADDGFLRAYLWQILLRWATTEPKAFRAMVNMVPFGDTSEERYAPGAPSVFDETVGHVADRVSWQAIKELTILLDPDVSAMVRQTRAPHNTLASFGVKTNLA